MFTDFFWIWGWLFKYCKVHKRTGPKWVKWSVKSKRSEHLICSLRLVLEQFCVITHTALGPDSQRYRKLTHPKSHSSLEADYHGAALFTFSWYEQWFPSYWSSRRTHFSVFRYRWTKNTFAGPKSFHCFQETGPWSTVQDMDLKNFKCGTSMPLVLLW